MITEKISAIQNCPDMFISQPLAYHYMLYAKTKPGIFKKENSEAGIVLLHDMLHTHHKRDGCRDLMRS